MRLAVRDHFLVGRDAQALQGFGDIRANTHAALRIHGGGPLEMDRAGDMPAACRAELLAAVFIGAAHVPDGQVGGIQARLQVLASSGGGIAQRQGYLGAGHCRLFLAHREAIADPGLQTTIEEVVTRVADHVEQPDEATGPGAALVVVDHINGIRVMTDVGEQRLELRSLGQQARSRWLAELRALGIHPTRPWNMACGITRGAAEIKQDQVGCIQAVGQFSRLDHQRQVVEGGHDDLLE